METMTAASPDGRTWKIDSVKEPFRVGGESGFSWSYIVTTAIVVGMAVVLAWVSWYFAVGLAILLLIWLAERISNHLRPRFRARTEGPPPEELTWKATSFARGKLEQRIVREIEGGNATLQPPGLTLLSHQSH